LVDSDRKVVAPDDLKYGYQSRAAWESAWLDRLEDKLKSFHAPQRLIFRLWLDKTGVVQGGVANSCGDIDIDRKFVSSARAIDPPPDCAAFNISGNICLVFEDGKVVRPQGCYFEGVKLVPSLLPEGAPIPDYE